MDEHDERAMTALFQRLPTQPAPPGLRDVVMARIARERVRRAPEAIVAAVLALPSLLFLLWELTVRVDLGAAVSALFDALSTEGQTGELVFVVDGLMVLALAMVGLAGVLLTHALLADVERHELRPVSITGR